MQQQSGNKASSHRGSNRNNQGGMSTGSFGSHHSHAGHGNHGTSRRNEHRHSPDNHGHINSSNGTNRAGDRYSHGGREVNGRNVGASNHSDRIHQSNGGGSLGSHGAGSNNACSYRSVGSTHLNSSNGNAGGSCSGALSSNGGNGGIAHNLHSGYSNAYNNSLPSPVAATARDSANIRATSLTGSSPFDSRNHKEIVEFFKKNFDLIFDQTQHQQSTLPAPASIGHNKPATSNNGSLSTDARRISVIYYQSPASPSAVVTTNMTAGAGGAF